MYLPNYPFIAGFCILSVFILRFIGRRLRSRFVAQLHGPPSTSWLVGNLPELLSPEQTGDSEFQWIRNHGPSMKVKGAFGSNIILTADPKALQYVLNTTGYNFGKPQQKRATSRLLTGRGLTYVQGNQHARQRRLMAPAFSYSTLRMFLPIFRHLAQKCTAKWKTTISENQGTSVVLNIPPSISRVTLDVIGEAALNYNFGAIEEDNNELSVVFRNLLVDSFYKRSHTTLAFEALWGYVPLWLLPVIQKLPTRRLKRLNNYMAISRGVARSILEEQMQAHANGKEGGKDVMSILIKANLSENPKTRLDEDEILSQLTTFLTAGTETTAATITWILHELSRHPEAQNRIREEIQMTRSQAIQRGDTELSVADLDSMKYMVAVIKETLRYHPTVIFLYREAGRDDVIPLSIPHTTKTGETVTSIPVRKGQQVMLSVHSYNRLESVWGDDAGIWKPERFLEQSYDTKIGLGMMGNLVSFGSGVRGCIGWRFATIEMQAILAELVGNFVFSPAPGNPEILRISSHTMTPMVKGSNTNRTELPLTVSLVPTL